MNPRRKLDPYNPKNDYMESDKDYVLNNIEACVSFLDAHVELSARAAAEAVGFKLTPGGSDGGTPSIWDTREPIQNDTEYDAEAPGVWQFICEENDIPFTAPLSGWRAGIEAAAKWHEKMADAHADFTQEAFKINAHLTAYHLQGIERQHRSHASNIRDIKP